MNKYILSCCSTADLSKEQFESRGISYICFHYELDGVSYSDDLGQSMDFKDFYHRMATGSSTKTSQVNAEEYEAYFRKFLEQGLDILHLTLSSGISGTINSANIAADTLREEFPDRRIYIVDSLAASSGYGLLMDKLADLRDEGKDIEEVRQYALDHRLNAQHWFFSTDLSFYVKGGRISKTSGAIGTVLGICPLLNVNNTGHLIPRYKIRTKKKVINAIVDRMKENAENGLDYADKCFISQSECYDDAKAVADKIEAAFPHLKDHVVINYIGTTIGSHTGPGTVALFFWGKERTE